MKVEQVGGKMGRIESFAVLRSSSQASEEWVYGRNGGFWHEVHYGG
jgi:hypothetical protein